MIIAFLTLFMADVVYGENPPIRVCDDAAYIQNVTVPVPPTPPMPARQVTEFGFIGPLPRNHPPRPLPVNMAGTNAWREAMAKFYRNREQARRNE